MLTPGKMGYIMVNLEEWILYVDICIVKVLHDNEHFLNEDTKQLVHLKCATVTLEK